MCNNVLLKYTEGATISEAQGIYKHINNKIVIEKTIRIELLFTKKAIINKISKELKKLFNQETIAIQEDQINSYLV